jgi:7,8-dihydropterin-6-yl-methyl-4-(beta-D-ribofuranosyl)aminobenzene 5'-phosphate synthase
MQDIRRNVTITVIFDNNSYVQGLETAWGFSCVVGGAERTILFDAGGDSSILLDNMEKLAVDVNDIDTVILSHIHADHTRGLESFLQKNPDVTVYLPVSFPRKFKDDIAAHGSKIVEVEQPVEICGGVYSVGRLGTLIKEQSLAVRTDRGLVVIAGCAHPGIVKIVKAAKQLVEGELFLVMGGFHLEWSTRRKIKKIISSFKDMKVRYAGPCHCSGHRARSLFQEHFGENYIDIGVGKVITLADLK